jgi:VRR-NUC domain
VTASVIGLPISEVSLHKIVAEWLDLALTEESWYTTFPLGSGGLIRGAQLKARGTKRGTPDILLVHQSQAYFIELKTRTGKLSAAQTDCHDDLVRAGARVATCRSIKDVAVALKEWRIPFRILEA